MTLTDEQIEEIKARVDAATPGPWRTMYDNAHGHYRIVFNEIGNWLAEVFEDNDAEEMSSDADFIAHARTDIPALLSALEAEKKRADDAEALIRLLEDDETVAIISSLRAEVERLREAGTNLLDRMFGTYKARNGREVSIQGDDGEKCWIVHSDEITALKAALTSKEKRDEN